MLPSAWASIRSARRVASRHKLRSAEGEALHNLFVLAQTTEGVQNAEQYALEAAERYLPDHHKIPALAYDLAYYWLSRGYPKRALPVLQRLVPHFPEPPQRIQVLSAIARAAGAAQDPAVFEQAWNEAFLLAAIQRVRTTLAAATLDLGYGSAHLEDWKRAEEAFRLALEASREYDQHDIHLRAEAAIAAIRAHRNPDVVARPAAIAARQTDAEQLAHRFVLTLGELTPSGR